MVAAHIKAVLLDLHGTLGGIRPLTEPSILAQMLSIPDATLTKAAARLSEPFEIGMAPRNRMRALLRAVGREEDFNLADELIAAEELETVQHSFAFPGAVETILGLQEMNLAVGLCVNGNPYSLAIAKHHRFMVVNAATFSFQVSSKKPSPKIYRVALAKLKAKAVNTLYVGNGGDNELEGASRLGMITVRVDNPGEPVYRKAEAQFVIKAIAELIAH